MRIIGGIYKSRLIEMVKSNETRPTMDKVRGSIFNIIGPYLDGGIALDLFSGTGAMGLEAISRGALYSYFVDISNSAIATTKKNISSLNVTHKAHVLKMDYQNALNYFAKNKIQFDYVFLDPPYKMNIISEIIHFIEKNNLLKKDGLIIAEYDKEFMLSCDLRVIKDTIYGIRKVTVFKGE